jgi:tetratricopeptide (TPR) repeat protein
MRQNKWTEAEPLLRQLLDAYLQKHGPDHVETLVTTSNLAALQQNLGKLSEAEALHRQNLEARRRVRGAEHPETLSTMAQLADVLLEKGELSEAESFYKSSLEGRRKVLTPGHPVTAASLVGLATVWMKQKNPRGAEPLFREAMIIRRNKLPKGHFLTAGVEIQLGGCLVELGEFVEAESLLLGGYESLKSAQGSKAGELPVDIDRIIRLYDGWQKPEKADEWRATLNELNRSLEASSAK